MRVTDKEMAQITSIAERALGYGDPVVKDDIRVAVKHVRWLESIGNGEQANFWHGFYLGLFGKLGVEMPPQGSDVRAITSKLGKGGGRPSHRPCYCKNFDVKSCKRCLFSSFGYDCSGYCCCITLI